MAPVTSTSSSAAWSITDDAKRTESIPPLVEQARAHAMLLERRAGTVLFFAAVLFGILSAAPARAGSQDGARLSLHVQTATIKGWCSYSDPNSHSTPCSEYTTAWPAPGAADVYLVVTQADSVDGIAGLSCGIDYDATDLSGVDVDGWTLCADLEFSSAGVNGVWPAAGSGVRITWNPGLRCQREVIGEDGVHALAGCFHVYAYGDDHFTVTRNNNVAGGPELVIGDCAAGETDLEYLRDAGQIEFSVDPQPGDGYNPCLAPGPRPTITSVVDVPNDQGRQVRITFMASDRDAAGSPTPILQYEAFRRIDPLPSPSRATPASRSGSAILPSTSAVLSTLDILLAGWEFVGWVPAHGESEYNMIVPTLADSTVADGIHWSCFMLRAATAVPSTFIDSFTRCGYSLDNLAPGAPEGLTFSPPGVLAWDAAPEPDFDYFTVYGSGVPTFDSTAVLVGYTTETGMNVLAAHLYFHVTATDFAGNEGPAASTLNTVDVPEPGWTPTRFAIGRCLPNPFRSITALALDLPRPERVRVTVYDVRGKRVATLVDGDLPAGRHPVRWPGVDEAGRPCGAGTYFLKVESENLSGTRKAILLR
jgi:hypothetical protein